jgi:hypothetical protein
LGGAVFAVALAGCPGDDTSTSGTETAGSSGETGTQLCTPGETQTCTCNGVPGTQECNGAGTGFGPCLCDGGTTNTTDSATGDTMGSDTSGGSTDGGSSSGGSTGGGSTDGGSSSGGSTDGGSADGGSTDGGSSSGGNGILMVGEECVDDGECVTGICWDFNDYDPLCFGAVCSVTCIDDGDCLAAMTAAGAPTPAGSTCGPDGRCTTLGTGFGMYACASG